MWSYLRRPNAKARPPIPPPTMATLKVVDLEGSAVGAMASVMVDSVLVVLEVEVVAVVVEVSLNFNQCN